MELNMYEDAMNISKKCNNTEALVTVSLQWIQQ